MGTWSLTVVAGIFLAAAVGGCTNEEKDVPKAEVKPVTAYGITLDESATPQQVTYVLLRSLADDVHAAQAHPPRPEDQKKANLITVDVCAPNEIEQRILRALREAAKDPGKVTSLGKDRDREIYKVVNAWGSIVAYYVDSFDKDPATGATIGQDAAMGRMRMRIWPNGRPGSNTTKPTANVDYEVWPDPSKPDANRHQTLDVELVKETAGGKEYWRVVRVAYVSPASRPATQPAGAMPASQPTGVR